MITVDSFDIEVLIKELQEFCAKRVPELLAEIQEKRFANQGQFNGHERWVDNHPKVIKEKGKNDPLYDSGELFKELTDPNNWAIEINISEKALRLTIPDVENFTNTKYDVLDKGGRVDPYIGRRTGKVVNIHSVPARPFKEITIQDIEWVRDRLVDLIVERLAA